MKMYFILTLNSWTKWKLLYGYLHTSIDSPYNHWKLFVYVYTVSLFYFTPVTLIDFKKIWYNIILSWSQKKSNRQMDSCSPAFRIKCTTCLPKLCWFAMSITFVFVPDCKAINLLRIITILESMFLLITYNS